MLQLESINGIFDLGKWVLFRGQWKKKEYQIKR